MKKLKKINGYLVVQFSARERREYEELGTYGVIDAELYTGDLDIDRSAMEYDDADDLDVAIEQARGLDSEEDIEDDRESLYNLPAEKRGVLTDRVYNLGMVLRQDCPDNDCRLYLNIFNMARELDEQIEDVSGYPRSLLEQQLVKHYLELERLYQLNEAVREYKRGMQP